MPESTRRVVLITGCSTGIGRACAEAFVAAGFLTVATARRIDTLSDLASRGAEVDTLDVTSDEDRRRVVSAILERHGRLDVLVNNAGYPEYGPFEEVGIERWRAQFETNVFGLVALSQLASVAMRAQGSGRIINISSMGGVITIPLGSAYHASKWAVEALSDVARFELAPFGVKVIVVQPGIVLSNFEEPAQQGLALDADSPWAGLAARFSGMLAGTYQKKTVGKATPADIARVVLRAANAAHPKSRYRIPLSARSLILMRRSLPDSLYDRALALPLRWSLRKKPPARDK